MNKRDVLALAIWWCEGAKARRDFRWKNAYLYPVEVTNTDPKIIKIFVDFLKRKLDILPTKLKGQLQIHKGDNIERLEKYWSEITGISRTQFNKTIVRENGTRNRKTSGTFKVRYYDKNVFFRLQEMLDNLFV